MMRDWSLGSGENRGELEMQAFNRIARQAAETHERALHYQRLGAGDDPAEQVEDELEAMRQALCVAAPGLIAAALMYLAGHRGNEFQLTPDQRQALHSAAGELDLNVWELLVGA